MLVKRKSEKRRNGLTYRQLTDIQLKNENAQQHNERMKELKDE
jgi:hypothetical protein